MPSQFDQATEIKGEEAACRAIGKQSATMLPVRVGDIAEDNFRFGRNSTKASMVLGATYLKILVETPNPASESAQKIIDAWKAEGNWPLEE